MSSSREQLEEDRALRNSARALFRRELSRVRHEVTPQALGERIADNVGEKVDAASDKALDFTRRRGGVIAAASGAIVAATGLWLARKPILKRLRRAEDEIGGGIDEEADDE
jgi:hypothetical protein